MLVSSTSQERTSLIHETVAATRRDIQTNQQLTELLGSTIIQGIACNLDHIQPATVRGGEIQLPDRAAPGAIPAVVIRPGEQLVLNHDDFGKLSTEQRDSAGQQIARWAKPTIPRQIIDAALDNVDKKLAAHNPDKPRPVKSARYAPGFVEGYRTVVDPAQLLGTWHNPDTSGRRIAWGVPIIGLIDNPDARELPEVTLMRELFQLRTRQVVPLSRADSFADNHLREELRGRYVASKYEIALYGTGDPRLQGDDAPFVNLEIDTLRRQNMGDAQDPFLPSPALRNAIAEMAVRM